MFRLKVLALLGVALIFTVQNSAAADGHPGSSANCSTCHNVSSAGNAPKVIPQDITYLDKVTNTQQSIWKHNELSCVGGVRADGSITGGCHNPDSGFESYLVVDIKDKPVDLLCQKCHLSQTRAGMHHPSYTVDEDDNGRPEKAVSVPADKLAVSELSVANAPEPVKTFPDAYLLAEDSAGNEELRVAIPLISTALEINGEVKTFDRVVTCTSCHNPHYGFLAPTGEARVFEKTARKVGDAMLRLADEDNRLCLACH
ncbi:MAG: hypothetical protein C0609_01625 [Deltaproteobacteria bacterium]|nr:MAG: hypothetical protein C0609_01625 [Deltaproteobacteria bacterium]